MCKGKTAETQKSILGKEGIDMTNSEGRKQGRIHGYLSRVWVGRGGEKKLSQAKLSVMDQQINRPTDRQTEGVVGSRARD